MSRQDKIDAFVEATAEAARTAIAYQEKLKEWNDRCAPELDPLADAHNAAYNKAVEAAHGFLGEDLSDDDFVDIAKSIADQVEGIDAEDIIAQLQSYAAMRDQFAEQSAKQAEAISSRIVLN